MPDPPPPTGPPPPVDPVHRLIRAALDRPRTTLAASVLATLLGIAAALTLRPGTDVSDMLPEQSSAAQAFSHVIANYRLIDDLVVVIRPDGADAELLRGAAQAAAERLRDLDGVAEVVGHDNDAPAPTLPPHLVRHALTFLDDAGRTQLVAALQPDALDAALRRTAAGLAGPGATPERRAALLADPFDLAGQLLPAPGDPDGPGGRPAASPLPDRPAGAVALTGGPARVLRVAGTRPANDLGFTQAFVRRVDDALAPTRAAGFTTELTGSYAIADFSARTTRRDMIVSMAVSMALLSALFLVVYRSPRVLPATLFTLNCGIVAAFGLYALGRGQLSPITAVTGAILAGLGIDYCIHLLAHLRHDTADDDPLAATAARSRAAAPALGLACLTSAVGFAATASAGVAALTQFAVLGVLGLATALVFTLTLFPTLLRRLPPGRPPRFRPERFTAAVVRNPRRPLFLASIVVGMAGMLLLTDDAPAPRYAADLSDMHPRPNPPLAVQRALADATGASPNGLLLLLRAPDADALLSGAHRIQAALTALHEAHPAIGRVVGPADLAPPPGRTADLPDGADAATLLAHIDAAIARGPLRPAALAPARAQLAEALTARPPPAPADAAAPGAGLEALAELVLPRGADGDTREALVLITLTRPWEDLPERAALAAAIRRAVAAAAPGVTGTLTGLNVMSLEIQSALQDALLRVVVVAALALLLILSLAFRQPYDVMLALTPVAIGVLALLAFVAATDTPLHAVNLIAFPLTVGLGVDDGVFLLAADRAARRRRLAGHTETRDAYARRLTPILHAITVTSLTTGLAFGSLAFTGTPAVRSLGLLSAIGVAACLLASLAFLTPFLVMRRYPRR